MTTHFQRGNATEPCTAYVHLGPSFPETHPPNLCGYKKIHFLLSSESKKGRDYGLNITLVSFQVCLLPEYHVGKTMSYNTGSGQC